MISILIYTGHDVKWCLFKAMNDKEVGNTHNK